MSGADPIEARPGFTALLARIAGNGVRTIIVETANRFARDLMVQEVGFAMLRDLGITLIAADRRSRFSFETHSQFGSPFGRCRSRRPHRLPTAISAPASLLTILLPDCSVRGSDGSNINLDHGQAYDHRRSNEPVATRQQPPFPSSPQRASCNKLASRQRQP